MTNLELLRKLNNVYGLDKWPETFEVDAETYGNVCQSMFDYKVSILKEQNTTYPNVIDILVGSHNGLMFKNVELILNWKS